MASDRVTRSFTQRSSCVRREATRAVTNASRRASRAGERDGMRDAERFDERGGIAARGEISSEAGRVRERAKNE